LPSRTLQTPQRQPNFPPPLSLPDLDQICINGLPPSTWTCPRHFGSTQRYHDRLHAPTMCGVWHNGFNHFVVFYLCQDYKTIQDPQHCVTSPDPTMASNIAQALTTIYLYQNLPVPLIPPFRRVDRIVIQNAFPQAPWLCGTIAILTTLHLTQGNIRHDNIKKTSISRRQYLAFHQSLLRWLIIGTPLNL
jgi:hypothetical protein